MLGWVDAGREGDAAVQDYRGGKLDLCWGGEDDGGIVGEYALTTG